MARSAAQKRATRKLVALNKRKRKGTTKGMVRKTARRAFEGKRKSSKTKRKSSSSNRRTPIRSMATRKRSRTIRRAGRTAKGILTSGIVGKAVTGIGAAALVSTVMNRILPGSPITGIAQPIAAYAAGGAVGAISSVLLNGGLGQITGFLGGQQAATPSVGNVEFGV